MTSTGASRTLPQALRDAAAGAHGCWFLAGGAEPPAVHRTYAELRHASIGVAATLRRAGLKRGDLVGLAIGDAELFLTVLYGASIAGVVPASLHPPGATRDLDSYVDLTARVLRSAGARALVTHATLVEGFERVRAACPELAMVLACEGLAGQDRRDGQDGQDGLDGWEPSLDDLAFVQFTSGATSEPKGVALTHRNLCANVNAINGTHGLATSDADSAVSWLPLHHDMGLVGMALGPLYSSRPAVFSADARLRPPAGRVAARDFPSPRHRQLRTQLCLRSVRAARQRRRPGRRRSIVLARGRLRCRADSRADAGGLRRTLCGVGLSRDRLSARIRAR